ncbi:MAG: ABC transporter permease subunit [bacterium]
MNTIFLRSLRNRITSTIVYALSGIGFLELYVALYPALSTQIQAYDQLAKAFPEAFLRAFGMQELIFNSFEGYISTEHFSLVWPLLVIFLTVGYAASTLAGEIEQRTMGLTLSQPVSRTQVYYSKYLAGVAILAVFTIVSIFAIVPLASLHGVVIQTSNFWTMTLLGFCFGLSILSLGFALSAAQSERSKVSMSLGGILIGMYVLRIVAGLKDSWRNIEYVSLFHYLESSKALLRGEVRIINIVVFLGISIVSTLLGWLVFMRRDIAV